RDVDDSRPARPGERVAHAAHDALEPAADHREGDGVEAHTFINSEPNAPRSTDAPAGTTTVVEGDSMIAGPSTRAPAGMASRLQTSASTQAPFAKTWRRIGATDFSEVRTTSERSGSLIRPRARAPHVMISTAEASSATANASRWAAWKSRRRASTSAAPRNASCLTGTSSSQTWSG